jgi:hypothetical protein
VERAGDTLRMYEDRTGPELLEAFIDPAAPRKLSANRIARIDVAKHGQVSPGIEEYQIVFMMIHAINDGIAVHKLSNMLLELLGGSATPNGRARTDVELAHLLDLEWNMRWGRPRVGEVIVTATETLLPRPRTKFQDSALKVDFRNVERRAIVRFSLHFVPDAFLTLHQGGQVFPRITSRAAKHVLAQTLLDVQDTSSITATCKSQRVTLANVLFALCNYAWICTATEHPEFASSKTLPMMMYTAISLRRYLPPTSSYMSLALGYCNIVLPSFLPRSADPRAMFWLRARSAQSQMRKLTRTSLLLGRSQLMFMARGQRAKAFAVKDDEADGTLSPQKPSHIPPPPQTGPSFPSVALMGITCMGELDGIYDAARYSDIKLVDVFGQVRKAKGGILLASSTVNGRLSLVLGWDAAAFSPGVIDEFWGHFVRGLREFAIDPHSHTTAKL